MQECASTNLYNDTVCIKKNRSWCMYNKTCNVSSFFKQVLRLFFCKYGHLTTNSIYGDLLSLKWYFSVFLQKDIFEEFEIFRLILMHFKFGLNFPLLPDAWVGLFHERVLGYLHPAVILFTTFWFLFTRFSMSIAQYPTLSYLFFMYHNYLCFLRIVAIKEIKLPLQSQDQNVFPTAICNLIGRKNNLMSEKRSSFPLPDKLSLRVT